MSQKNLSNSIYILDALRTPVGSTFKSLKDFSAAQLGAAVIKELVRRAEIKGESVNEVILGNTVSAGTGQNLARQAAVLAGLPVSTPAFSVNNVCGSGLQSVILAAQAIRCQEAELVVAGGTESASQSPGIIRKEDEEKNKEEQPLDSVIHDGLRCQITNKHMGELAEFIAEKFKISREEQDQHALESHLKACHAQEQGKFLNEITRITIKDGQYLAQDERPRKNINLERLASLPAAFKKDGTVTAGNSSIPSDGAAAVLLASEAMVKKYKSSPKARILGYASVATDPEMVFTASILSIQECLKKCRLSLKEVDLFEISEAFAVQAIVTQRELKIPSEQMNILGSDVAIGHPLGAAGARILVTLLHALHEQKKKIGLATVCLGGGGAVAVAIEALS